MRYVRPLTGWTLGAAALASSVSPAFAQPTLDRVLSDASIEEGDHCAVLRVDFNFPVRYVSHFPSADGEQVRIRVRAVQPEDGQALLHRESVRAPESQLAGVTNIEFDGDARDGATLTVLFDSTTFFSVGQGSDFRSIAIAVNDGVDASNCTPQSRPGSRPISVRPVTPAEPVERPSATEAEIGVNDPLLAEARAAMTQGDNAYAVQLLTRIIQTPEAPSARAAQELLGLARERGGQLAHARAEYEEYLRRYPSGEDTDRVRQRLAALLAAEAPERPQLREPDRARRGAGARWDANASFSQYYFHDNATYTYEEQFGPTPTTTTESLLHQNELLTALDLDASVNSGPVVARMRAAGSYSNDYTVDGEDEGSLSALYLEIGDQEDRFVTRVGRQTRSTSGIFGRFDGATASIRPGSNWRVNLAAGYPVDTPRDVEVDPDRLFYAASIDYQGESWNASVYRFHQETADFVDRDSVGLEYRYVSDRASVFTLADYDVHYGELNIGLANGSFTLGDTTLNLGYDQRRAPMLATINALIGQTVASLDELRLTYTDDQIEQLALDRSAEARTVFLGLSHEFNERFSISADTTLSELDGTPASGGVASTDPTGQELYASVQFIGTSMFKEGDLGIIGIRFADTAASTRYGFDLNTRYPVSRALRINPRLRVSYRENKTDDGTQVSARPSVRFNWQLGRRVAFELDTGAEWQVSENSMMREEGWDYFVTAGYRLDF